MSIQNAKLYSVVLFVFLFACGRSGSSGHRGVPGQPAPAEEGVPVSKDGPAGNGDGSGPAANGDGSGPAANGPVAEANGPAAEANGPVAYDVWVDNSASMDGYLYGPGTDFKNDIHHFLKDLQTQGLADTINLGYVNERVCRYRENASVADVNAFIKTLNHDSLVKNQCGRKDSYIDAMIERVIGANPDHVHVLVSDYVFSIGRGNSGELLKQQGDNVESVLTRELRQRGFSTLVLKFSSDFDGTYYVESKGGGNGSAVMVHGIRRPYYMMIFGDRGRVRQLEQFFKVSRFQAYSGFVAIGYLLQPGGSAPAAKLIRKDRVGNFVIAEPATRLVINKAVTDSGDLQFAMAVNLEGVKLDEPYLTNPGNYELPDNYRLAAIEKVNDPTNSSLQGFTHVFLIRTNDLKPVQQVYIRLKSKIPKWVYTGSTMDDSNPADTAQQKQTFGFQYLFEGMDQAYKDRYKNMDVYALNVQVSEMGEDSTSGGGGHSGFPWVPVVVVGLIAALVIWIKNKR